MATQKIKFLDLPPVVHEHIFAHLHFSDKIRLESVSKKVNALVKNRGWTTVYMIEVSLHLDRQDISLTQWKAPGEKKFPKMEFMRLRRFLMHKYAKFSKEKFLVPYRALLKRCKVVERIVLRSPGSDLSGSLQCMVTSKYNLANEIFNIFLDFIKQNPRHNIKELEIFGLFCMQERSVSQLITACSKTLTALRIDRVNSAIGRSITECKSLSKLEVQPYRNNPTMYNIARWVLAKGLKFENLNQMKLDLSQRSSLNGFIALAESLGKSFQSLRILQLETQHFCSFEKILATIRKSPKAILGLKSIKTLEVTLSHDFCELNSLGALTDAFQSLEKVMLFCKESEAARRMFKMIGAMIEEFLGREEQRKPLDVAVLVDLFESYSFVDLGSAKSFFSVFMENIRQRSDNQILSSLEFAERCPDFVHGVLIEDAIIGGPMCNFLGPYGRQVNLISIKNELKEKLKGKGGCFGQKDGEHTAFFKQGMAQFAEKEKERDRKEGLAMTKAQAKKAAGVAKRKAKGGKKKKGKGKKGGAKPNAGRKGAHAISLQLNTQFDLRKDSMLDNKMRDKMQLIPSFLAFPPEIYEKIFQTLPYKDKLMMESVCKDMRHQVKTHGWKQVTYFHVELEPKDNESMGCSVISFKEGPKLYNLINDQDNTRDQLINACGGIVERVGPTLEILDIESNTMVCDDDSNFFEPAEVCSTIAQYLQNLPTVRIKILLLTGQIGMEPKIPEIIKACSGSLDSILLMNVGPDLAGALRACSKLKNLALQNESRENAVSANIKNTVECMSGLNSLEGFQIDLKKLPQNTLTSFLQALPSPLKRLGLHLEDFKRISDVLHPVMTCQALNLDAVKGLDLWCASDAHSKDSLNVLASAFPALEQCTINFPGLEMPQMLSTLESLVLEYMEKDEEGKLTILLEPKLGCVVDWAKFVKRVEEAWMKKGAKILWSESGTFLEGDDILKEEDQKEWLNAPLCKFFDMDRKKSLIILYKSAAFSGRPLNSDDEDPEDMDYLIDSDFDLSDMEDDDIGFFAGHGHDSDSDFEFGGYNDSFFWEQYRGKEDFDDIMFGRFGF